jgi:hypothetical protein
MELRLQGTEPELLHLYTSRPPSVESAATTGTRDAPLWLNFPGDQLRVVLVVTESRRCVLHEREST